MFKMVEVIREAFRNTRLIGSLEINNLALQNRNYVLLTTLCVFKEHIAVGLYYVSVYVRRRLRRPFQGLVVNVYQTKSLRIAILPFEIVHEAPVEISSEIDAVSFSFENTPNVSLYVL